MGKYSGKQIMIDGVKFELVALVIQGTSDVKGYILKPIEVRTTHLPPPNKTRTFRKG